jgi:hypothetical protein
MLRILHLSEGRLSQKNQQLARETWVTRFNYGMIQLIKFIAEEINGSGNTNVFMALLENELSRYRNYYFLDDTCQTM